MQVTAITSNVWGVTRGAENTTPVTHATGFTIQQVVTAGALQNFTQYPNGGVTAPTGGSNVTFTIATYVPTATDIPAAGVVYDINSTGFITTGTTGTLTVALTWNGTTIASAVTATNGPALIKGITRNGWWLEGRVNCYGTATMVGALNWESYSTTTVLNLVGAATAAVSISGTAGPLNVVALFSLAANALTATSSFIHRIS